MVKESARLQWARGGVLAPCASSTAVRRTTLLCLIHRAPREVKSSAALLLRTLVGACRDGYIEGGSLGYRHIISVVDRPSFHLCIVHGIYWMVVVYAPAASGIPVLRDREYGVGFAVGKPIIEVGVVSAAVLIRSAMDERGLVDRSFRVLEIAGRSDGRAFCDFGSGGRLQLAAF